MVFQQWTLTSFLYFFLVWFLWESGLGWLAPPRFILFRAFFHPGCNSCSLALSRSWISCLRLLLSPFLQIGKLRHERGEVISQVPAPLSTTSSKSNPSSLGHQPASSWQEEGAGDGDGERFTGTESAQRLSYLFSLGRSGRASTYLSCAAPPNKASHWVDQPFTEEAVICCL